MRHVVVGIGLALALGGCAAGGESALTAGVANGTVGEWTEVSAMPHGRAGHCAAVVGDRVLAIGGAYKPEGAGDFVSSDEVHVATVLEDGTLGAWSLAGRLPSGVNGCTAVADEKRVLVMGGLWESDGDGNDVWAAALSEADELSAFASIGTLPAGATVLSSEAFVSGGELLLFDTEIPEEGDETFLLRAPLSATVGEWSRQALVTRFLGYPQLAFDGEHLIVAGGYLGADAQNAVVADVAVAPLGSSVPGAPALPLPDPTAFGRALAIDGHLFVFGGKDALFGGGTDDVYSTALDADGRPVDWTTQRPLPADRTSFALAVARNHVLVLGGGDDGPGLDSVFSARIRW